MVGLGVPGRYVFFGKGEVDVFFVEDEKSDINIFSGVRHEEVV